MKKGGERCVRVSARLYEWSVRTEGGGRMKERNGGGGSDKIDLKQVVLLTDRE